MLKSSFHWIVKGRLAGTHSPSATELKQLRKSGFNAIVCLQSSEPSEIHGDYDSPEYTPQQAKELGFETLNIPIPDMAPPTKPQMRQFVEFTQAPGRVTVVHCYAGMGRTGCMLAAYLGETENLAGIEAVRKLRRIWLEYIQSPEQQDTVVEYLDEAKLIREHVK